MDVSDDPESSAESTDESDSDEANRKNKETEISDDQDKLKANPGWADAIAKVLRQKKAAGKKTIVLSKAKKIKDVKEKKPKLNFEIVGEGDEKSEEPELDVDEKKPVVGKKLMMKEYQARGRVKPSVLDKDRERTLMKIATKGVVQLFNAVRQQQKMAG